MNKKEIDRINELADEREKSGRLLVHKDFNQSMSVQEKFRFNLCLKISEELLKLPVNERVFEKITNEDSRRIIHKHYNYFTTDRLLEILNTVIISSGKESEEREITIRLIKDQVE